MSDEADTSFLMANVAKRSRESRKQLKCGGRLFDLIYTSIGLVDPLGRSILKDLY